MRKNITDPQIKSNLLNQHFANKAIVTNSNNIPPQQV